MDKSSDTYRRVVWGLSLICLVSASIVFLSLYLTRSGTWPGGPFGFFSNQASTVKVSKTIRYKTCGCEEVDSQESIDESMRDKYVESLGDEWQLERDTSNGIELVRITDGYCPTHAHTRLITISYGHVAVYRGTKALKEFHHRDFPLLQEKHLSPQDSQLLRRGIVVEGSEDDPVDEKVAKYLEGILD
jgi:hypothetical protein